MAEETAGGEQPRALEMRARILDPENEGTVEGAGFTVRGDVVGSFETRQLQVEVTLSQPGEPDQVRTVPVDAQDHWSAVFESADTDPECNTTLRAQLLVNMQPQGIPDEICVNVD
jgi:hypothetical protein